MFVIGQHSSVISNKEITYEVGPFISDYEVLQKVPVVDSAIVCMCPYPDKPYILIVKN